MHLIMEDTACVHNLSSRIWRSYFLEQIFRIFLICSWLSDSSVFAERVVSSFSFKQSRSMRREIVVSKLNATSAMRMIWIIYSPICCRATVGWYKVIVRPWLVLSNLRSPHALWIILQGAISQPSISINPCLVLFGLRRYWSDQKEAGRRHYCMSSLADL